MSELFPLSDVIVTATRVLALAQVQIPLANRLTYLCYVDVQLPIHIQYSDSPAISQFTLANDFLLVKVQSRIDLIDGGPVFRSLLTPLLEIDFINGH